MISKYFFAAAIALPALCSALSASALPLLKSSVLVTGEIVTLGDMFENAGTSADRPVFRAPAPGTAGEVPVDVIRAAVRRIGVEDFDNPGFGQVRVERSGLAVDETELDGLIETELRGRGIILDGMSAEFSLDAALPDLYAAEGDTPVSLADLRYQQGSGGFTARFRIAGTTAPLDISGRLDLMIEAPHLNASLSTGAIIRPDDVVMQKVALRFAEAGGFAALDQVEGKQLRHSSRAGMLIRPTDVMEPELIARNDLVTLILRDGPMTLTVKGQALNNAARGDNVAVLNLNSKKVVQGIAIDRGAVQVGGPQTDADL